MAALCISKQVIRIRHETKASITGLRRAKNIKQTPIIAINAIVDGRRDVKGVTSPCVRAKEKPAISQ